MHLFDDIPRSNPSPASHNEFLHQFLNRVGTPYWEEVRRLLESWYQQLPNTEQRDIGERFRARDDRQAYCAFWELYLHEALSRLGFTIEHHPSVPGYTTRPDFLVSSPDAEFYLEAVMLSELENERLAERRRASIYDAINQIPSPNFYLWADSIRETPSTPSLGVLRNKLSDWLRTLDPDDRIFAGLEDHERPFDLLPRFDWQQDGWHMQFTAIPRPAQARGEGHGPTLGALVPSSVVIVDDHSAIRQRLEAKARKYGQLDKPYAIALLSLRATTSRTEALEALFGPAWEHPSMIQAGRIPSGGWHDGLWMTQNGPVRRHLSALITTSTLRPWTVGSANVCLVHNPWAIQPLMVELPFESIQADLESGALLARGARLLPSELFSIGPNWPPGEPFPGV